MTLRNLLASTAVAAALGLAQTSSAGLIDTLDTEANLTTFNGLGLTNNLDGTFTFARSIASYDQGVDWGRAGGSYLSVQNDSLLTLTPVGPVSGGYYNVNILLFDSKGAYLAEPHWLGDNNSSAVQTLDVAQWVSNLSQSNPALGNATQYFLRIRIDPWGQAGAAFKFTEISAVAAPEPTSGWLLLAGLPLLWAARRRSGKA